jgi:hypothetical protein
VIDDMVTIAGLVAIAQIASDTVTIADLKADQPLVLRHHRHQALPAPRHLHHRALPALRLLHHRVVRRQMLLKLLAVAIDVALT